ncbi:MAG: hypothetical protein KJ971_04885 [Firmicutes bacterium]|nr:hypothetical protein [Bacillota bacterium]
MNRKALIFIVFMLGVLSIMAVGVWGASPDPSDNITMNSIFFSDDRIITNESGDKIIFVEDIITDLETNYEIQIGFEYLPSNAYAYLIVRTNEESVAAIVQGNLVYVAFSQKDTVSITITDKNTEKTDTVTLVFRASGQVDIPDDIFD